MSHTRFRGLDALSGCYQLIGWSIVGLTVAIGVLLVLIAPANQRTAIILTVAPFVSGAGMAGFGFLAIGYVFSVLIAIEENTRQTAATLDFLATMSRAAPRPPTAPISPTETPHRSTAPSHSP